MKAVRGIFPAHLKFLLFVHLFIVGIFTLFRYITLVYNRPRYNEMVGDPASLSSAFKVGFQFDITVASYLLLLPYLVLTVAFWANWHHKYLFRFVRNYCVVAILFSILISVVDVPYFNFFNSRFNAAAVSWKNNAQVAKYIVQEIKYYPFILAFLGSVWAIGRLVRYMWKRTHYISDLTPGKKVASTFLATLMLLAGLFGGVKPHLPNMNSATFSSDGFVNQLSLNPVHTWFDSLFDFDIHICSLETAIQRVQRQLGIKNQEFDSPIARKHHYAEKEKPVNVVMVLMESMCAAKMGAFGQNPNHLTPYLDSLARSSVFFDSCFSNGIHTNAGLYSTLYGLPIMMMQHPMANGVSEHTSFTGLPVTLRDLGYETMFFCTHPKTFDNLDVFLEKNGFNTVSDIADYPAEKIANSWGVGDETLFENAVNRLNTLDKTGKPFFATLLTITAHPPFILPAFTKFKAKSTDPVDITYEYADWSIRQFMDSCAKQPWYDQTVFVFLGDHGINPKGPQDVPINYNHIPLIIHAPKLFPKPEVRHQLANQIDVFPTIMGLLERDYVQNTLGYDLFREKRPFAFFSQDHKLGVVNSQYLYVARKSGRETMYDYRNGYGIDVIKQHEALADSMKNYATSMLQVSQWLIKEKKNGQAK